MIKITGKGFRHLHVGPVRIKLRHDPLSSRMGWPLIKAGPLDLFSHTNAKQAFVLASWHDQRSITWRWSLWCHFADKDGERRPIWHSCRPNSGLLQWTLNLGLARFSFNQQRSMWKDAA